MTAGLWFGFGNDATAGGETRTISLYHVHTKESLTITYKVDGRYIPSALEKINYLMRDWRRKEVIRMDPKTIDLMWELHADLGSTRPVHIICGYRSPKTNSFLKRIGRNVAKKSQHMVGKAIDLYFPDVSTEKLRNSALVRQVGGVGYYRSSGPSGFVHIDSGKVRMWPRVSPTQLARIFRDYRKTVGARLNRNDQILVASAEQPDQSAMQAKIASMAVGDDEDEGLEAGNSEADAGVKMPTPRAKPAVKPVEVVEAYPVPLPRPKPIEVLMMAAANMQIEPASAPPKGVQTNFKSHIIDDTDSLGAVAGAESMVEEPDVTQTANISAKGSFADSLRDGTAENVPMIRPLTASAGNDDLFWWPKQLTFSPDQAIRRDGAPQQVVPDDSETIAEMAVPQLSSSSTLMVAQANAAPPMPAFQTVSGGKSDMLEVNRSAKGSMLMNEPVVAQKRRQTLGQFIEGITDNN
ncbi:DUF882 domain-containing protein [Taklimakanibacter lacteus]|uniref:DUF882 domain-containing protein n=1 Tax=Taklimakanibacter lacteus TaxID=2268456 RepID=UPI0013C47979